MRNICTKLIYFQRIASITTTLQFSLEGSFLRGLDSGNVDILRQCLRTYALIDKMKDAESLYRQHIVKPYMEQVGITEFVCIHMFRSPATKAPSLSMIVIGCPSTGSS